MVDAIGFVHLAEVAGHDRSHWSPEIVNGDGRVGELRYGHANEQRWPPPP
jgi:hypothetical protein